MAKEQQYYVCKMEKAKDGLGIVSVDLYEGSGWSCEITFEGSFQDCVDDKQIQFKSKNKNKSIKV